MDKNQDDKDANSFATWTKWIFVVVIALWILLGVMALNIKSIVGVFSITAANAIDPGTFGDMFGAANALFSALAIAGVVLTLWVQIKELKEARDDRETNLKHQEVIAKSQERAAEMQLKVAQSGDVYAAYARVAGSQFLERIQRLRWLATLDPSSPKQKVISYGRLELPALETTIKQAQPHQPPQYYQPESVQQSEMPPGYNAYTVLRQRVIQDVQVCVSAIVDLRPLFILGLIGTDELKEVLRPDDCRFVLELASRVLVSCDDEVAVIKRIANDLADAAK